MFLISCSISIWTWYTPGGKMEEMNALKYPVVKPRFEQKGKQKRNNESTAES